MAARVAGPAGGRWLLSAAKARVEIKELYPAGKGKATITVSHVGLSGQASKLFDIKTETNAGSF